MTGEQFFQKPGDKHARARRWPGSLFAAAALTLAGGLAGGAVLADGPDEPAHSLADRFAGASKPDAGVTAQTKAAPIPATAPPTEGKTDAALKAYEDEMLARAREEARSRSDAELAREQQIAEERRRLEAEENGRKLSERLRAAREARRAKEAQEAEAKDRERRAAEADALRMRAEAEIKARADAEAKARADAEAKAEEEARERVKARLAEHSRRLADKIESRKAAAAPEALGGPLPTAAVAVADAAAGPTLDGRTVTVLLVMDAGHKGIRRWNKNADPMLCVDDKCYISKGLDTAAKSIARTRAFGPGVALGDRAGACRNKLVCAFRGVSLASDKGWMQPIDLRILRHDRRTAQLVSADKTCHMERGKLVCSALVEGGDYRAWIVPEPTAESAGPAAIEAALQAELVVSRGAAQ